jgi:hypothetical protein
VSAADVFSSSGPASHPPALRALCALHGLRRRPTAALVAGFTVSAILLLASAHRAGAVILPAQTIDGPNENIVGFGGVAMAEDGTGGLVYLKRVEGVPHVFVSRYAGGRWLAPIRVDAEEPYAASWPLIGAADGGELVVVWATPFATENDRPVEELLGATLGPGAAAFGPARIVDRNIEEGTGTSPDLAMSSNGQADVVYRVVETSLSNVPLLRPGDVVEQVRVAHYNGNRWSGLGAVNRNLGVSMRPPTQDNAPQIAIGPTGAGIVVWQEPDIEGVARIWARRIFGAALDYVMPVSASTLGGVPVGQDADAPSVAFSRLGQAEIAYRKAAGPGSPLQGPRIFVNTVPDGESESGAEPVGATVADAAVPGGAGAFVGPPSVDIDERRDVRLLYDAGGTPRVVFGANRALTASLSLGPPFAGAEPSAASAVNPAGGGLAAWPSADANGNPAMAVREDFPGGAVQTALVGGGAGGPVGAPAVGRSGLGDGLIAFQQGPLGDAAVVAAEVTAPPAQFLLSVPSGRVRPSGAVVSWTPAPSADGPLTYTVVLDGHQLPVPAGALKMRLGPRGLANGSHIVQVLAVDASGQATLTPPATLRVGGAPRRPRSRARHARVRRRRRRAGVR